MTLDQVLDRVGSQLDARYRNRIDRNAFRMIEAGCDDDSVRAMVEDARQGYGPWRAEVLVQLRASLLAEAAGVHCAACVPPAASDAPRSTPSCACPRP